MAINLVAPRRVPAEETPQNKLNAKRDLIQQQRQARLALVRGIRWLALQQAEDGGWHSKTYASLKGGIGNTALIVSTLSELDPASAVKNKNWSRAVSFLISRVNDKGLLEASSSDSNYPLYSTSLLLHALADLESESHLKLITLMSQGLVEKQRIPNQGWSRDDPCLGGWGPGSLLLIDAPETNPANISVTFNALNALAKTGSLTPKIRSDAMGFLGRCQLRKTSHSLDGGFVFTLDPVHPLNKAGWSRTEQGVEFATPYLSATCDGISALLVCGIAPSDNRIESALAVLPQLKHSRLVKIPLNSETSYSSLDAIYFYSAAALARVGQQVQTQEINRVYLQNQKEKSLKTLIQSQHSDGSWSNPLPWMMEDDPLIATAFALQTIHRWLSLDEMPAGF